MSGIPPSNNNSAYSDNVTHQPRRTGRSSFRLKRRAQDQARPSMCGVCEEILIRGFRVSFISAGGHCEPDHSTSAFPAPLDIKITGRRPNKELQARGRKSHARSQRIVATKAPRTSTCTRSSNQPGLAQVSKWTARGRLRTRAHATRDRGEPYSSISPPAPAWCSRPITGTIRKSGRPYQVVVVQPHVHGAQPRW